MSSSGTTRGASKSSKTKTSQAPQQTHSQNANKTDSQTKVQATAEQLRMASIISDKRGEDPELKGKVKQVMDVTGREEEEIIVALHDCDNDTNRAINMLLEGGNDQGEWQETSSKKKKKQPTGNKSDSVIDIKPEKREKSKEREYNDKPDRDRDNYSRNDRRNRQPPRLARKHREMRENLENERNLRNDSESRDRGGRGRGRGHMNGPGRGRGRGRGGFKGNRFDRERERGPQIDTWTNETAENAEKENSNWAEGDDWTADEWTGSLEDSKVFTASGVEESSKVFSGMGDNDAKMFTPPVTVDSFSSTFSPMASATNGGPALNNTTNTLHTGASLINSLSQSPIGTRSTEQLGQKLDLGMLLKKPDSDATSSQAPQFSTRLDLGMLLQGKPTVDSDTASQQQFMSQLTKSSEALKNAIGIGSSSQTPPPPSVSNPAISSTVGQPPRSSQLNNTSPMGSTTQLNSANPTGVNSRPKAQRTKLPPPSKIPASAVEMPGHIGAFQLDVQFGSLSFGKDSGGFSIGDEKPSSGSFPSTDGSTATPALSNHIGHVTKSSVDTPPSSLNSVMTSSVISSVTSTTPSSVTGLDAISQSLTQSPRPGMYQNSAPTTPSKQEYGQSGLAQPKMTPPDPIPFPSQERKSSPHYPRASQTSSSVNSKSISSPPYSQSGYSSGYSSSGYPSQKTVTTASTYSHASNSLNSAGINSQYANHSNHQNYQTSSFQNQNSFNSSNQVPSQGSSLYQSTGQSSGSYQGQSGSSYQNQTNSTGYSNQSGSYQNQGSGYHSRDSQSTSSYQPSISQSGSSYQSGSQSSTLYNPTVTQSSSSSYQRDGQSNQSGYGSHQSYGSSSTGHQNNLQTSPLSMPSNKLSDSISKISVKDSNALDSHQSSAQHSYDGSSSVTSSANLATTTITAATSLTGGGVNVSSALGLTSVTSSVPSTGISSVNALSKTTLPGVSKAPPNLPPGVPLVAPQNYIMGQIPFIGIAPAAAQQPIAYNYEELQSHLLAQQQRGITMPGYYDMPLQPPTTLTGRDQNTLASAPYTAGADGKLNRVDAQSPVQAQTSSQQQHTTGSTQQQAFINPAAATLPPGYNYYTTYPGSMLPAGYQYSPAVFPVGNIQVPAVTQTAHGGTTGATQFQKPGITGSYATYATGYDDLSSQTQDFSKYGTVSSQNSKPSGGSAITTNAADLTGTYGKTHTQSYDKTGFHHGGVAGTPPPPFSLPLATVTQAGQIGAPTAAAAFQPPYGVPMMAQPHSQMLHHHMQQDSTGGSSRAAAQSTGQPKTAAAKTYGATTYWGTN